MGLLSIVNHFGTFLLLVATILLVIASITAPTVDRISFLTVDLGGSNGEITFGSFGWCLRGSSNDECSGAHIGYDPAEVITRFEGSNYSTYRQDTAKALTNVMILHPIAAGVSFIAFILSIGTSFFGSFMSSLVAGSAFLVTLVALICDWVWMAIVANNVNARGEDISRGSARAHYDAALWCALAAAICALIASVILFFTCCAGRRNRSRAERSKADYHSPPAAATTTRRRWWSRSRY